MILVYTYIDIVFIVVILYWIDKSYYLNYNIFNKAVGRIDHTYPASAFSIENFNSLQ